MKERRNISLSFSDRTIIEQLLWTQLQVYLDADVENGTLSGFVDGSGKELTCREFEVWTESLQDRMFHADRQHKDATPPGPSDCPDCGEIGVGRGHMGCQYPSDDPNIEGLKDPMEYER